MRGAADEEEEAAAEGLGLCFCFETGCFLGAIWPRGVRAAVSSDRHRRRRAGLLKCRVPE